MKRSWPDYRTIWRWHFYAGLFCIPFVLWLSVTGTIYLFKPQVEAWLDEPYDHLSITGSRETAQAQVAAALAAVPGARFNAYELPPSPDAAARILVGRGVSLTRVYVHPQTLSILGIVDEDDRLMAKIQRLHGELMLGDRGSMLVELAASWAIVMLLTGLYLWWPRKASGVAGVLYPRLGQGGRVFWRDLHAVTGLWVSFFALFMLVSGLPWAKSWGNLLKEVRHAASTMSASQDWTTGRSDELAQRIEANAAQEHHHGKTTADASNAEAGADDFAPIDRLVQIVAPMQLAPPVLIAPPSKAQTGWTARSESQNRLLRVKLNFNATTGEIIHRSTFSDRAPLDRLIAVGISAHEGQLFGWFNQALGVFTAAGLILVASSALLMWWRRREPNMLGAPPQSTAGTRLPATLLATILLLGLLLPLFGITLVLMLILDRTLLRRVTVLAHFFGRLPRR